MARKRMIDPSLWQDEGMAELTPRQQLLYIGLFSNADDEGRLKGSATAIRLALPTVYGGVGLDEIEADITAVLATMRQLTAYEVESRRYLVFLNYPKWQRIDRPSPSVLPAPPDMSTNDQRAFAEPSTNDQGALDPNRKEEKLSEEKRKETRVPDADAPTRRSGVKREYPHDSEEYRLASLLRSRVRDNIPNVGEIPEPTLQKWANTVRLMVQRDQRTHADIEALIDWAQADEFWFSNILSMDGLREKFDKVLAQKIRKERQSERARSDSPNSNGHSRPEQPAYGAIQVVPAFTGVRRRTGYGTG